jgi:hypothetical protein
VCTRPPFEIFVELRSGPGDSDAEITAATQLAQLLVNGS